ncbi:MAG: AMP-binding protein [Chloroflexi bacterium]|nr:AMP-binding protein [Chloroflexota bacterium]
MSESLKELMNRAFATHAERVAVRVLASVDGDLGYHPISYRELETQRNAAASGLARLGVEKGQRVAILTDGGIEPLLIFLAADLLGICAVPLCSKVPPQILVHNLNHSGAVLLVTDQKGHDQIAAARSQLRDGGPRIVLTEGNGEGTVAWRELVSGGDPPPEVDVSPSDESKILYTSGSSGMPKGVIQTHANIVANVRAVWDVISDRDPCRFFKSAPDYHSMGILNIYFPLAKGWVLDLARSPDRVLADIRLSEPQGFLTVPLVLDKVFGNVRKEISAGGAKGWLVGRSVAAKRNIATAKAGAVDRLIYGLIGRKVVEKIKDQLAKRVGSNLEVLVVGSAKADPEALDFFHHVLDIKTYEGYGTTECAPLIAANHMQGRKSGTVGRPLFTVKLLADDGSEVGFTDPDSGDHRGRFGEAGELWVSGPNVMKGYLHDETQTSKALVSDEDGRLWYRTGDLFSTDAEGFLTFHGRVGRQFKLANGEFVNPELLERVLSRAPLVEHLLVAGRQEWSHPLVIVTLDVEEASKQADLGLAGLGEEEIRADSRLSARIREHLLHEADSYGLPLHERPQRILVLPEALSEEAGTLTRGLKKVVPGAVLERYSSLIDAAMGGTT